MVRVGVLALAKSLDEALSLGERFVLGHDTCQVLNSKSCNPPPAPAQAARQMADPLLRALERYAPLELEESLLQDPSCLLRCASRS